MEIRNDDTYIEDGFSIADDRSAAWAVEKIRAAREDTERWRSYYAGQLAKIEEANANTESYFSALLERYFAVVPRKVTKTQQSYQLPNGKLVLKAQQPSYDRDESAMIPWAKDVCPSAVKIKESIAWEDLKKHLAWTDSGDAVYTETGEIVPGIKAVQRDPVFVVKIDMEVDNHG